jgi:hypothetical protein
VFSWWPLGWGADPGDHAAEQRALQIPADTPERYERREGGESGRCRGCARARSQRFRLRRSCDESPQSNCDANPRRGLSARYCVEPDTVSDCLELPRTASRLPGTVSRGETRCLGDCLGLPAIARHPGTSGTTSATEGDRASLQRVAPHCSQLAMAAATVLGGWLR